MAPCAMCSRARLRSVCTSERKGCRRGSAPPAPGVVAAIALVAALARGAGRGGRTAARGLSFLVLVRFPGGGERLVVLGLRFLLAGLLFLAFLVVAALL